MKESPRGERGGSVRSAMASESDTIDVREVKAMAENVFMHCGEREGLRFEMVKGVTWMVRVGHYRGLKPLRVRRWKILEA